LLLVKKILELIEGVLLRSRILIQKRLHSIFFGTKAEKRKLPILKERWFDIASPDPLCSLSLVMMAIFAGVHTLIQYIFLVRPRTTQFVKKI
jgi:hypothetical protein